MSIKVPGGPARLLAAALSVLATNSSAYALDSARVQTFMSPHGQTERCVALASMPGAVYTDKDVAQENFFCGIDMYAPTVAACPKFWSTSPGTIFYTTDKTGLSQSQFEASRCSKQKAGEKLAKFKTTMNAATTSGTFAPSSLLYYHFSRELKADVKVPVAVYRTFDKDDHLARVTSKAHGAGAMNVSAWKILAAAERNPVAYKPVEELFTPDHKQIYGVILRDKGTRYGAELNGTRAGGWGNGQNLSFQETPGFLALRSEKPLEQAMNDGQATASKNAAMNAAVHGPVSKAQMVFWMKELTEITLLDYIFSQQDRVGNIDYIWTWYYMENGKLKSKEEKAGKDLPRTKMASIKPPAEIASLKPVLIQRTSIGDNDAGGRSSYANFTKRTQMLQKIRHYNGETYRRLMAMNADFKSNGPQSQWLKTQFSLSGSQITQIKTLTAEAASILQQTCRAGKLQFDLDPVAYMMGSTQVERVDCQ